MKKLIISAVVILLAFLLLGNRPRQEPTAWEEYTVKSGDTVSGIANDITPDNEDYMETMYDIIEKNNIKDATIYSGQVILIPMQ